MTVIPYEPKYKQAVQQVCIRTAYHDQVPSPKDRTFTLSMYCNNYLDNETAFLLMDGEDPVGYILCAEDHDTYARHMEPYLKEIKKCGLFKSMMARGEMGGYRGWKADYPAHLHIDILEEYTGGTGGMLMEALLSHLKEKQVPGVMLMVSTSNPRAIRFYEKMGFQKIAENKNAITYGQKL